MKPSRFTAGVYDWDADVVGRPAGDRWQQLGGDTPGAASESFPMVILVLTAEIYPNALLLQRRTPANSSSGFDLLANVSGRCATQRIVDSPEGYCRSFLKGPGGSPPFVNSGRNAASTSKMAT